MIKRLSLLLIFMICSLVGCSPDKVVVKNDDKQLSRDYKLHDEILPVDPGFFPDIQPWQTVNANLRRKVYFNDRQTMVLNEATKTDTGTGVTTRYHYHELSGYVLSGNLLVRIGKNVQSIGPGGAFIIPSNVHYAVLPLTGTVSYLETFTPARDDLRNPPVISRFDENDVKSLIHKWYAYLDKLVGVNNYLPFLATKGLVMSLPGTVIRSQDDFKNWYAGMLKKTKTNMSKAKDITVTIDKSGNFVAEFTVSWESVTSLDEQRTYNSRQTWTLGDLGGATPVILTTAYKEISNIVP
jgi:mannose-6-phosphate isomerase-like protein (cupin superfamily)